MMTQKCTIDTTIEVLTTYRGRFGNFDETTLRKFEFEAVQATFS
jgi:hypothetical protein